MAKKKLTYTELSRYHWTKHFDTDAAGNLVSATEEDIRVGAALRCADALGQLVALAGDIRTALARVESLIDPEQAARRERERVEKEKARRTAESLARAEAAYRGVRHRPDVLARPVADLNLSTRARNALHRDGITTVGELVRRTADDLRNARNFGKISLTEVRGRLAEWGLALAGDAPAGVDD